MKFLLVFLLLPFYCLGQSAKEEDFSLNAVFTGFSDGTKFYLSSLGRTNLTDSSTLNDGKVSFIGKVSEPTIFRLQTSKGLYTTIWVEKGSWKLSGDSTHFKDIKVLNSKLNDDYRMINDQLAPLYHKADELFNNASKETDKEIQKQRYKEHVLFSDSIDNVRIANLFTLEPTYPLMQELYFLRNTLSKDSLNLAYNRFPDQIKNSDNGQYIYRFLETNLLAVGDIAPDIKGKTIDGDLLSLSDYRGKIVLLDFWAGWCGPCRDSNKQLVALYNEYKNKGFEIFSFNMDTKFDAWDRASKADGITWSNVSDLLGHYSPEVLKYRVQAIPRAYLISQDGKILKIIKGYSEKNHEMILEYLHKL